MWKFLPEAATPFIVAAVQAPGPGSVGDGEAAGAVGEALLSRIFGLRDGSARPGVLARLAADPGDQRLRDELGLQVCAAIAADPALASEAAAVIAAFYRQRAAEGDVGALVELGDFLYWDEPESARTAFEEAVAAGHLPALLDLARVLRHALGDTGGGLAVLDRAAASEDADVSAEAMYEIASDHVGQRDAVAARVMFERVIASRHPVWAAAAMTGLADMLNRTGDRDGAVALYREAAAAGDADWSGHASFALGSLLEREGDATGATAAWQRVVDGDNPEWATPAFTSLVNLLAGQCDADGIRAAYARATALGTPDAPYALVRLGGMLADLGDADGARAAWQQAIDAGCEDQDGVRELMDPAPEPEWEPPAYPPDLPPELNPANTIQAGLRVLEHGLPALPEVLTRDMAVPVACWTAERCAVVLILSFARHGTGQPVPMAMEVVYSRAEDGRWVPPAFVSGGSFCYDPVRSRDSPWDPDAGPLVYGGYSQADEVTPGRPAVIAAGRAAPEVKYLALVKDGREDRRPVESHFGAWVVCTEHPGPFEVAGLDADGTVLATLPYPLLPPPRW